MRYLLVLLLLISWAGAADTTWVHNIPCTDNAANTTVTNNGTGAAWVASGNTNTIYNLSGFDLHSDNENIKSSQNWTEEDITIIWTGKLQRTTPLGIELHVGIHALANHVVLQGNDFWLYRYVDEGDEWIFRANAADGTDIWKISTDFVGDTDTHKYRLVIDASVSPWVADLYVDGTALSWGAWTGTPAVAVFNSPFWVGSNSTYEPDTYFKDIKIISTSELPVENTDTSGEFKKNKGTPGWKGW